jgi:membrane-associated phospholipid phosphatase
MPGESSAEFALAWRKRIPTIWRLKLGMTILVGVMFWSLYLFLSRHAFFSIHKLPITPLDTLAGFQPRPWALVYESNFLLVGIIPWLIASRDCLRRYVVGFALLSGTCFLIFALFPVAAPRPADLGGNHFLIFITRVDGPLNAFPSLHAGTLVYALALARRLFGGRLGPVVAGMLLIWAGLILFATLATKQHYALDLLAGGMLGWAADWFVWRNAPACDIASTKTARKVAVSSQAD